MSSYKRQIIKIVENEFKRQDEFGMEPSVDDIVNAIKEHFSHLELSKGVKDKPLVGCAAGSDGDCNHSWCPQLRDGEPEATGRHCPLDKEDEDE